MGTGRNSCAALNMTPERKARLVELRAKIHDLWKRGKTRREICGELGIEKKEYQNQLTFLRRKGLISYVDREKKLIGTMPRLAELVPVGDAFTPEGMIQIQQIVQEKARPILTRMKHLLDKATPNHEQQVKMAQIWVDLFKAVYPRQPVAPAPGSGLTVVFNGVNRGPKAVEIPASAEASAEVVTESKGAPILEAC